MITAGVSEFIAQAAIYALVIWTTTVVLNNLKRPVIIMMYAIFMVMVLILVRIYAIWHLLKDSA